MSTVIIFSIIFVIIVFLAIAKTIKDSQKKIISFILNSLR